MSKNDSKPIVKPVEKKPEPEVEVIKPQVKKIQFDINYIVIDAPSRVALSTKVNDYLERFKHFVPLGGMCFSNDNGECSYSQAMYNRERNLDK